MGDHENLDPESGEVALTPSQRPPAKTDASVYRTSEELVAKPIAPMMAEYLLPPPPTRPRSNGNGVNDNASERKGAAAAATGVVMEKKSKRQLKRDRRQEQKSPLNICSEVAKQGRADACRYGGSCRFSHDLDAFLAQKPADLEGCCPFLNAEGPRPYGITCRFFKRRKENNSSESLAASKKSHEINNLNKDFQRLLWKNKVKFPKADAQLKLLGLRVGNNQNAKPGICQVEDQKDNLNGSNDLQVDDSSEMPGGLVNNTEYFSNVHRKGVPR